MLTLELLQKMLLNAAVALKDNVLPLCELDSVAGDGDHGLTIGRMADAMKAQVEAGTSADMKELLDDLSMAFMGVNGGSAGPLWGTVFGGFAEGIDEGVAELDAAGIHKMLEQAKAAAPLLFKNAGASCVATGHCPEGAMTCGRFGEMIKMRTE